MRALNLTVNQLKINKLLVSIETLISKVAAGVHRLPASNENPEYITLISEPSLVSA